MLKNVNKNSIQPKLKIGQPNDSYEQEADRVADQVMRMPATEIPSIRRKCEACEEEELQMKPLSQTITPIIQKKGGNLKMKSYGYESNSISGLESSLQLSKGSGEYMNASTQQQMSHGIGADFSNVKIHTGGNAIKMNKQLNAKAFTNGSDVYFNQGQYNPKSSEGKHLLAHELTHVVQQTMGNGNGESLNLMGTRPPRSDARDYSQYEIEDAIFYVSLALNVARETLTEQSLPSERLSRIETQITKLNGALDQLHRYRGTDGQGLVFDFDLSPELNEIVPGDASKSISELFLGIVPNSTSYDPNSDEVSIQAKLISKDGISISPLDANVIQRFCDPLICLGILIVGGLLFSGCNRRSSRSCPKSRIINKDVHVFTMAGASLNPTTEMSEAARIWRDVAGINLNITYHSPFDEARTRELIGTGNNESSIAIGSLLLDYSSAFNRPTDEMLNLTRLRQGDISVFFVPILDFFAESAIDPRPRVNNAYIGQTSSSCPGAGLTPAHEIGHLLMRNITHSEFDSPLMRPRLGCRASLTDLECRMARGEGSAYGEFQRQGGEM